MEEIRVVEDKKIELYDHQMEVVDCGVKRRALFGGVGSGKSYAMMLVLVGHLLKYPGTNGLYVARTKEDLAKKNYVDFREAFGGHIKHEDKQRLIVTLKNGSKVLFVHGWDDEKGVGHLDGYNCSIFLMSQAEEMPRATYDKLVARNRKKDKGEKEWLELMEGNPRGKNWIYELFCQGGEKTDVSEEVEGKKLAYGVWKKPDSILVQCQAANYDFVPPGYLESLMKGTSDRYQGRYILGNWDSYTGMVYDCWNEKTHMIDPFAVMEKLDEDRYARILGFDWGHRVPSAAVWGIYDRHEDSYLFYREHYEAGLTAEEQARRILEKTGKERIDICIADTQIWNTDPLTGTSIALVFQKMWPWPVVQADKNIERGKERCYKYLSEGKAHFFKGMNNFRKEIEEYRYEDDAEIKEPKRNLKEKPLKKNDHALDAWRYMIAGQLMYVNTRRDKKSERYLTPDFVMGNEMIHRTELE